MTVKAISKDIIIYDGQYTKPEYDHQAKKYIERPEYGLLIKVTDYRKGYWAEAPMERGEVREVIKLLTKYLKERP